MSQKSAPLHQLLQKDAEWSRGKAEADAFAGLKTAISSSPVLEFCDSKQPVSLSVDASSIGLGVVILQNDRPVAYTLKALTLSQQKYVQIKKEILAFVLVANTSTIICMGTVK